MPCAADDGREDESDAPEIFSRHELIAPARLRQLSRITPLVLVALLGFDCVLMVAMALFAERVHRLAFTVVAIIFIGARQFGMVTVALHDGGHGLLFRDRQRND